MELLDRLAVAGRRELELDHRLGLLGRLDQLGAALEPGTADQQDRAGVGLVEVGDQRVDGLVALGLEGLGVALEILD